MHLYMGALAMNAINGIEFTNSGKDKRLPPHKSGRNRLFVQRKYLQRLREMFCSWKEAKGHL